MKLPKDHLSVSQIDSWDLCQIRWAIFSGAYYGFEPKSLPDFALHSKIKLHETVLEYDLGQKIETNQNRAKSELSEYYRNELEQDKVLLEEDPNLEVKIEKAIEDETKYFDKIIGNPVFDTWRLHSYPVAVETRVDFEMGGIPIVGYVDLIGTNYIEDLKRRNRGLKEGEAANSRQLITYSVPTKKRKVSLCQIVENKSPSFQRQTDEVTPEAVKRVEAQFQAAASAMETGIYAPVNKNGMNGWVCSARFCGAWRSDSIDMVTGKKIACPFGERSQVSNIGVN